LKELSGLESGMLTERNELTGERNVDWRNWTDWRAECWLKEMGLLENEMLTEGTERPGERNVEWRNWADCRWECWPEGTEQTGE